MPIDNIQKRIFHYVWRIFHENYGIIFEIFLNLKKQQKKSKMKNRKADWDLDDSFESLLIFPRVTELQQTRADGNVVKITEYDLSKDNFNPIISGAVRTHSEKVPEAPPTPVPKRTERQSRADSRARSPRSPVRDR